MGATIIGGQKVPRNELCPCNSGLKFKRCHGDEKKRSIATRVANQVMMHLIMEEKHKKKMITDEQREAYMGEPLSEKIDYMVGTSKKSDNITITGESV